MATLTSSSLLMCIKDALTDILILTMDDMIMCNVKDVISPQRIVTAVSLSSVEHLLFYLLTVC